MNWIINKHWTDGGTGLTNFGRHQLPLYKAAIELHGDGDFAIAKSPLEGPSMPNNCSLHWRKAGGESNATAFWRTFEALRRDFKTPTIAPQPPLAASQEGKQV